MSFQPPQPPQGQPSWGAQPPAGGLGYGPPSASSPAATAKAKRPKMVSPIAIIAALVLIGIAVAVFVVSRGGESKLDGEGAAAGFEALAADAEYNADGFADLRRCPFGEQADLTAEVADLVDVSDELLDGTTDQYLIERTDDFPESLLCTQLVDDPTDVRGPTGASYYAGELPGGDYESFLEDSSFSNATARVDDTSDFKGGTIYPYCTEPDTADTTPLCGADWVDEDNEIVLGVYFTGDRLNSEDAVAALELLLPTMVTALADEG